ncbi:MAG: bifunctional folylpolyglutamate synthase/dihydrofolate synthase, partial [Pseudomonadota bacterium]
GALDVIEAQAAKIGAPLLVHGQHWHVRTEHERLVFEDESGLCDLPLPNLLGAHQVSNAGAALAGLRHLKLGEPAWTSALQNAEWPARMQRLRHGPLVELAAGHELWLDGGHNAAAGAALASVLADLPLRPTYFICGMLKTKDVAGYLRPLASGATGLVSVSIPGETATLSAEETAAAARDVGVEAHPAASVEAAIARVHGEDPAARILICGSLYLAGQVLRENG